MTIDELSPGMRVSWLNVTRGGYGFPTPVDAIVLKIYRSRVRIQVPLRDGHRVERLVMPDELRPRYA